METVNITINDQEFEVPISLSVRKAALKNGIYIPGLCSHPELNPFKPFQWSEQIWQGQSALKHSTDTDGGWTEIPLSDEDFPHCDLCLVSINYCKAERACTRKVEDGMSIRTIGEDLNKARRNSLKKILEHHPHACLTCAQREGCDRIQCSMNVPVEERCCELLGLCEIGKVSDYIGIAASTPAYINRNLNHITNEPLILRNFELCINCMRCVRICRDLRKVDALGAVLVDGQPKVGSKQNSMLDSGCLFCGACVELCPTGALLDHPDCVTLIDGKAPCISKCPLEIDIPGYIDLIRQGRVAESLQLIREQAILPGVLGYACFYPCEDVCRSNDLEDPVSICDLKRYASDSVDSSKNVAIKMPLTGKMVAVIGGGPAGLAASGEILRNGNEVTVYEAENRLGGMLNQTIPEFRLPDSVIERDLNYLRFLGLKEELNCRFGTDVNLDQLRNQGYEAILFTLGLPVAVTLGISGEDLQNVEFGLEFLRKIRKNEAPKLSGKVIVIGGGNVAVDAAMCAVRIGAQQVELVCLEESNEMPAFKEDLSLALEEGITVANGWGVKALTGNDGILQEITLKKCLSVFDNQNKFSPKFDETNILVKKGDFFIVAIGQNSRKTPNEFIDTKDDIFWAGDASTGPSSIVQAMADGKRVGSIISKFLQHNNNILPKYSYRIDTDIGTNKHQEALKRINPLTRTAQIRVRDFALISETFDSAEAYQEAGRCMKCSLRADLLKSPLPPDPWHHYSAELVSEIPSASGVLICADSEKISIKIHGVLDLRAALEELLEDEFEAEFCRWEEEPMYTKRETELIQAHLQAFGEIPGGDDMDDLF